MCCAFGVGCEHVLVVLCVMVWLLPAGFVSDRLWRAKAALDEATEGSDGIVAASKLLYALLSPPLGCVGVGRTFLLTVGLGWEGVCVCDITQAGLAPCTPHTRTHVRTDTHTHISMAVTLDAKPPPPLPDRRTATSLTTSTPLHTPLALPTRYHAYHKLFGLEAVVAGVLGIVEVLRQLGPLAVAVSSSSAIQTHS